MLDTPDTISISDIKEKVKELVKEPEFVQDNLGHVYIQAILDVVNKDYVRHDAEYFEQCEVLKKISPVLCFVNIYAGFSYQTCNGGLMQYFDNGYASGIRGIGRNNDGDITLHEEIFVPLFTELNLDKTEYGSKVYSIVKLFNIDYLDRDEEEENDCRDCDGSGTDDDGDECENCEGVGFFTELVAESGVQNDSQLDMLSDMFYKVNSEFELELDSILKEWINGSEISIA